MRTILTDEHDFDVHENETACGTHFHMKGLTLWIGMELGIGLFKNYSVDQVKKLWFYMIKKTLFQVCGFLLKTLCACFPKLEILIGIFCTNLQCPLSMPETRCWCAIFFLKITRFQTVQTKCCEGPQRKKLFVLLYVGFVENAKRPDNSRLLLEY